MRALSLAVCSVVSLAHAGPTEQTITVKLASGKLPTMGPAPRLLSENATASPLVTADGAKWVGVENGTLVARELPGGKPRALGRLAGSVSRLTGRAS